MHNSQWKACAGPCGLCWCCSLQETSPAAEFTRLIVKPVLIVLLCDASVMYTGRLSDCRGHLNMTFALQLATQCLSKHQTILGKGVSTTHALSHDRHIIRAPPRWWIQAQPVCITSLGRTAVSGTRERDCKLSRTGYKSCITIVGQAVMEKTNRGPRIADPVEMWPSARLAKWLLGHAIQSLAALRNELALTAPTSIHLTGSPSHAACHHIQFRSGASQISHRVVQFQLSESRAVIEPQAIIMAPTTQQISHQWPITAAHPPASSVAWTAAFHFERCVQRLCPMVS
ncbi:hypothetical protein DE146DRAFT_374152 [Phaeosphaeria sp. MPI-PUGE-AT-0046c]|nr:hypothetical protein DE146DRAFT_374152 [Phaeosphaeria sp. MPI-PUGE-AT-0046c]